MTEIAPYLKYLAASEEPLSADVFVIEGDRNTYVYDVGCSGEALELLSGLSREPVVILSHFHRDHVGNIEEIACKTLYVGKKTYDKIHRGTVIRDKLTIEDGVNIEILRCPSPHAKGSLILTVNAEYTLLGDLFYTRKENQEGVVQNMLHVLRNLDTKYFVASHMAPDNIFPKDVFLEGLYTHYT